jgi:plasmid stabilization system protein ParE
MNDLLISPNARVDLEEIWSHYATDLQNPDAADRIHSELFDALRKLARNPGIGHLRSDLACEPLRYWCVRRYLIIYRGEKRPVEIVRVLHGARDVQAILGGEGIRPDPIE